MELSLIGILVCVGLLMAGGLLRAPLILGLFASLPFGSTAIATLGGSSPQAFTAFAVTLLAGLALSRNFADDLAAVLASVRAAPLVATLAAYAAASAILFPRLFAGWTSALVVVDGAVVETPLGPAAGNITQTAYLALGALVFFALCVLLLKRDRWRTVTLGFLVFATVHAALGTIDIAAKLAGLGDVLAPIRTANYALLVDIMEEGFWRIVGGQSEASAFAGYTLPCLAFALTYWRLARSRYALGLSLVLLLLLVFSTSATGYASLSVVAAVLFVSVGLAVVRGRLGMTDLQLLAILWIGLAAGLCVYLYRESAFDPFFSMIDTMVLNKAVSYSGQERAYWNARGMDAFFATYGIGIGMGSSRTSSWLVSVLSQLGVAGAVLVGLLVVELLRGIGRGQPAAANGEVAVLGASARAAGLAWLVGLSVSGGSADPGLVFFICLATVACCRERLASAAAADTMPRAQPAY